jgi:peptidoglycan hydrolase CwlO-like protein
MPAATKQINVETEFPEMDRERDLDAGLTQEDIDKIDDADSALTTVREQMTDIRQQLAYALQSTAKAVEEAVREKDAEIARLEKRVAELEEELNEAD